MLLPNVLQKHLDRFRSPVPAPSTIRYGSCLGPKTMTALAEQQIDQELDQAHQRMLAGLAMLGSVDKVYILTAPPSSEDPE